MSTTNKHWQHNRIKTDTIIYGNNICQINVLTLTTSHILFYITLKQANTANRRGPIRHQSGTIGTDPTLTNQATQSNTGGRNAHLTTYGGKSTTGPAGQNSNNARLNEELTSHLAKAFSNAMGTAVKQKNSRRIASMVNSQELYPTDATGTQTRYEIYEFTEGELGSLNITDKEMMTRIRSLFARNIDLQIRYAKILNLGTDDFINICTLGLAQAYSIIKEEGTYLWKLINKTKDEQITISQIIETVNLVIDFLADALGSEYRYLRIVFLEPLRNNLHGFNPQVVHDQITIQLRKLRHSVPMSQLQATEHINNWLEQQENPEYFLDTLRDADNRYMRAQLVALTDANEKAATNPPLPRTTRDPKPHNPRNPNTPTQPPPAGGTPTATNFKAVDMSGLDGYCFSALKQPLPKPCTRKECKLKHDGFSALPEARKQAILKAAKKADAEMKANKKVGP